MTFCPSKYSGELLSRSTRSHLICQLTWAAFVSWICGFSGEKEEKWETTGNREYFGRVSSSFSVPRSFCCVNCYRNSRPKCNLRWSHLVGNSWVWHSRPLSYSPVYKKATSGSNWIIQLSNTSRTHLVDQQWNLQWSLILYRPFPGKFKLLLTSIMIVINTNKNQLLHIWSMILLFLGFQYLFMFLLKYLPYSNETRAE